MYLPQERLFLKSPEDILREVRKGNASVLTSPEHMVQMPRDVCSNCLKPGRHRLRGGPGLLRWLASNVFVSILRAQVPECRECRCAREAGRLSPEGQATLDDPVRIVSFDCVLACIFANAGYATRFMKLNRIDPIEGQNRTSSVMYGVAIDGSTFRAVNALRKAISASNQDK